MIRQTRPNQAVKSLQGDENFTLVWPADEVVAPYSPGSLAVKIVEEALPAWATHRLIRSASWGYLPAP